MWRRRRIVHGLSGAILVALALAGCVASPTDQLRAYEQSVREEADWLWNNLNYVRANLSTEQADCSTEPFKHPVVRMTAAMRQADPASAALLDRLDYAALLIEQAHAQWMSFCGRTASAPLTARALEERLLPAYEHLNGVRVALLPAEDAPAPGST